MSDDWFRFKHFFLVFVVFGRISSGAVIGVDGVSDEVLRRRLQYLSALIQVNRLLIDFHFQSVDHFFQLSDGWTQFFDAIVSPDVKSRHFFVTVGTLDVRGRTVLTRTAMRSPFVQSHEPFGTAIERVIARHRRLEPTVHRL